MAGWKRWAGQYVSQEPDDPVLGGRAFVRPPRMIQQADYWKSRVGTAVETPLEAAAAHELPRSEETMDVLGLETTDSLDLVLNE